jgi:Flp pilus assembly protein TadB
VNLERKQNFLRVILKNNILSNKSSEEKETFFEKVLLWYKLKNLNISFSSFLILLFVIFSFEIMICLFFKLSFLILIIILIATTCLILIIINIYKGKSIEKKELQLEQFLINLSGNYYMNPNLIVCIRKSLDNIDDPLKSDFEVILNDCAKGLLLKDALKEMIARNDSKLIEVIVSGLIAANEKGTDLNSFLKYQIEYIREKKTLINYIKVLSSGPKYTSYFIMFIPLFSILLIALFNKNFLSLFYLDVGIYVLIYSLISFLIGFILINKVINNIGKNILKK